MPRPAPLETLVQTRREFLRTAAIAGAALAAAPVLATAADAAELDRVVAVKIHPAIGIARVGNSRDSFYFGPEVPGTVARPPHGYKDADGAIARQAARFRLYGYDRRGRVVREITERDGNITWTVSVANKKAQWYGFDVALDLPIATGVNRRNAMVTDRASLVVAPGPRSIEGKARTAVPLDGGSFQGDAVSLGELMMDGAGRLVFLPGDGRGVSPTSAPLVTFSDNDGWADDICDGPVQATVRLGSRVLDAAPAWVASTPPNYGPGLAAGLVTSYDVAKEGWDVSAPIGRVSFQDDVLPILRRIVDMQWVNAGFLASNGWGSDGYYLDPAILDQLANPKPSATRAARRRALFDQFRDPNAQALQPDMTPQMYGDGTTIPASNDFQYLSVTPLQYQALSQWADGKFVDDRRTASSPPSLAAAPVADQPALLDRAALESCLGGAFHPGIELPWTLRVASMWDDGHRLRVRTTTAEATDYGPVLTPDAALAPGGPLDGSGPGDLTRWQGTPWQSDAGSCRYGYDPSRSVVLPTFWPARIPNHVLRQTDYDKVVDEQRPLAERRAAFGTRYDWERWVAGANRTTTLDNMMAGWWKLGLVERRPGPGDGHFPRVMKVESNVGFSQEPDVAYGPTYAPVQPTRVAEAS